MRKESFRKIKLSGGEAGVSLIEMILVVMIMAVLTTGILISFDRRKLYAADDQCFVILDALQQARQLALNSKSVMRVEINQTQNNIQMFDENLSTTTSDDVLVKKIPLGKNTIIGSKPANVTTLPTASFSIPVTDFSNAYYPAVVNDKTITLRFTLTGNVLDEGTNALAANAAVTGATIFVSNSPWDSSQSAKIIRAIIVNGITGDSYFMKGMINSGGYCSSWKR